MPVMDGFAATERIREAERGRARTPVVALTASALVSDRERCLGAGMDDYVAKPIDPDALAEVLDRWAPRAPEADGPLALHGPTRPIASADDRPHRRRPDRGPGRAPDAGRREPAGHLHPLLHPAGGRPARRDPGLRGAGRTTRRSRMAAHELKGSAATIGAVRVAALCARAGARRVPGARARARAARRPGRRARAGGHRARRHRWSGRVSASPAERPRAPAERPPGAGLVPHRLPVLGATATARTGLAAFHRALVAVGLGHYNLVRLSSVIPPGHGRRRRPSGPGSGAAGPVAGTRGPTTLVDGHHGDRVYCVYAEHGTDVAGRGGVGRRRLGAARRRPGRLLRRAPRGHAPRPSATDIRTSLADMTDDEVAEFAPPQWVLEGVRLRGRARLRPGRRPVRRRRLVAPAEGDGGARASGGESAPRRGRARRSARRTCRPRPRRRAGRGRRAPRTPRPGQRVLDPGPPVLDRPRDSSSTRARRRAPGPRRAGACAPRGRTARPRACARSGTPPGRRAGSAP